MVSRPMPPRQPIKKGVLTRLFDGVIGTPLKLIRWAIFAIVISIFIEWIGIIFWWDINHSQKVLNEEISYLSDFNRNLLLNIYPADLATSFMNITQICLNFVGIGFLAEGMNSVANGFAYNIGVAAQSIINIALIFSVRFAMIMTSLSGFLIVALLAFMDGLTEREIRKSCGGMESAMVYHYAKRWIGPSMIAAFALYLTIPISIHPTMIILPAMFITGFAIYVSASTFKKYL